MSCPNTGENGEHVTVFLMPGLVLQADLDLPPQDIEVITFSIGAKFSPPQLNWVKIQVSTDQVVPMATLSDDPLYIYLPAGRFCRVQSPAKWRKGPPVVEKEEF